MDGNRDLNYSKYFNKGEMINKEADSYTSIIHKANVIEIEELLLSLDFIRSLGD